MRATAARLLPAWLTAYDRAWLGPDVIAAVVIWSVVVPQCVAYAQIAGLPPQAGLLAAPGALLAYGLLGTSRTLVVSATTATSAVSAAAVGPLAHSDPARFAALSAALALVVAGVLVLAGRLRLGGIADLVSKPVMTGLLFGIGITIIVDQLPSVLGVAGGSGSVIHRVGSIFDHLDDLRATPLAVGLVSLAGLAALKRLAPRLPGTLIVLAAAIAVSAAFDLRHHGVDVVGHIPSAVPHPTIPDVHVADLGRLLPAAFGVLVMTAEAIGVARALATVDGYRVDVNRDLVALGASNLLAGLSQGFVQSGGASQTAAAENAGGRTQLASIVCALLILLTGAFLAPLFTDLPEGTLGAIVVVALTSFLNVPELRRYASLRQSAVAFALVAIVGVVLLGVLRGLIVAAALSLAGVVQRLSKPEVWLLAREPLGGGWHRAADHPDLTPPAGAAVVRVEGALFYPNAIAVKERILELARGADVVVLDLSSSNDLDVQAVDTLAELDDALRAEGAELRLAEVRRRARDMLARRGLEGRVPMAATIDAALAAGPVSPGTGDDGSPGAGGG